MKKLMMIAAALSALVASAEITITGVSARQSWPWNSLVDVDFTIGGTAGEAYAIDISATAAGGDKKLCATTFVTEPIASVGKNRIVWDLGADYPNFKADDLRVTVTATPFSDTASVYLVVDLSGGTSAAKWPVRYTTAAPVHTPGAEDPCKTTELWLKRVKAGNGTDGYGSGGGYLSSGTGYYAAHSYVLTNDYYLGVFELTQAQCYNISGSYNSYFTADRATRPVDSITYKNLRWGLFNPSSPNAALESGVVKNLRDRTGLKFDLPTEWQWVHACKAGSSGTRYSGASESNTRNSGNANPPSDYEYYGTKANWSADYGTSYVDAYDPNPWGFYGMLGNVWEFCLNNRLSVTQGETYTDPLGTGAGNNTRYYRGGSWGQAYSNLQSHYGNKSGTYSTDTCTWYAGARICLTIGR